MNKQYRVKKSQEIELIIKEKKFSANNNRLKTKIPSNRLEFFLFYGFVLFEYSQPQ